MSPPKSVKSPASGTEAVDPDSPGLIRTLIWMPVYIGCLVVVGVLMLGATVLLGPVLALMPARTRTRYSRRVIQWIFQTSSRLIQASGMIRIDAHELESLAGTERAVFIANHPSLLDAFFIVSYLPNAICIMKSDLSWNPFLGPGSKLAGYIPNSSPHAIVRVAVQRLREGGQLVIFPEGTRTRDKPMAAMKGAFATIASRAEVPVIPVLIESNSRFLSKGWPLWKLPAFPIWFRFRVGRAFNPRADREEMLRIVEDFYGRELSGAPPDALQVVTERATQGQV